jgi:hypothetical protein
MPAKHKKIKLQLAGQQTMPFENVPKEKKSMIKKVHFGLEIAHHTP